MPLTSTPLTSASASSQAFGMEATDAESAAILKDADTNADGTLDLDEFYARMPPPLV